MASRRPAAEEVGLRSPEELRASRCSGSDSSTVTSQRQRVVDRSCSCSCGVFKVDSAFQLRTAMVEDMLWFRCSSSTSCRRYRSRVASCTSRRHSDTAAGRHSRGAGAAQIVGFRSDSTSNQSPKTSNLAPPRRSRSHAAHPRRHRQLAFRRSRRHQQRQHVPEHVPRNAGVPFRAGELPMPVMIRHRSA